MKFIPYFVLLTTIGLTRSSIYSDVKDNVLNIIKRSFASDKNVPMLKYHREKKNNVLDVKSAQAKAKVVNKIKKKYQGKDEPDIYHLTKPVKGRQTYHMDPVLNFLARRAMKQKPKRAETSGTSSSSIEVQDWKDEWREHWIQKKFEAINTSVPRGDSVNMIAARPWGVPCGDPNQHDMPWGSCMLPMECESEYRIYRGDFFCGRTQFVCCALQLTTYDMYQGFDVSFAQTSMETDSEEKRNRLMGSKERKRRKKQRDKKHRQRERLKRKRQIKRNIQKIVREIKKILSKMYRNGTTIRKKKTKQLKRFIKNLKDKYREDRKGLKNIHELELTKIDNMLQRKLDQIKGLNKGFVTNQTFRDIVVNGTVSPQAVRMLVKAYPELVPMLDKTRRTDTKSRKPDYLDYDIEYGLLYY